MSYNLRGSNYLKNCQVKLSSQATEEGGEGSLHLPLIWVGCSAKAKTRVRKQGKGLGYYFDKTHTGKPCKLDWVDSSRAFNNSSQGRCGRIKR